MSWAQTDLEKSFSIGGIFLLILYGIVLYMYFQVVHDTVQSRMTFKEKRNHIVYASFLVIFISISIGMNVVLNQIAWLYHRDEPGGPIWHYFDAMPGWEGTLAYVGSIMAAFLSDALLLYRCYVVCRCRRSLVSFVAPCLAFVGSIAMGITRVIQNAHPHARAFEESPVDFAFLWVTFSVGFNIVATTVLCVHILTIRRRVKGLLGDDLAKTYTGIMALLVESAAPLTLFGVLFLVLYGLRAPSMFAMAGIWGLFAVISPLMILLRVVRGRSLGRQELTEIVSHQLAFARSREGEKGTTM